MEQQKFELPNPLIFVWRKGGDSADGSPVYEYRCIPGNVVGWGSSQSDARDDLWRALEEIWCKEEILPWVTRHLGMSTSRDRDDYRRYGAIVHWRGFLHKLEKIVRNHVLAIEIEEGEDIPEPLELEAVC